MNYSIYPYYSITISDGHKETVLYTNDFLEIGRFSFEKSKAGDTVTVKDNAGVVLWAVKVTHGEL